jgi:hypothetical protein
VACGEDRGLLKVRLDGAELDPASERCGASGGDDHLVRVRVRVRVRVGLGAWVQFGLGLGLGRGRVGGQA